MKCPRCRRVVRPPRFAGEDDGGGGTDQPLAEAAGVLTAAVDNRLDRGGSPSLVCVPRYVIYLQGFLLGAVALIFFVFGLVIGSASRPEAGVAAAQACTISGTVVYDDGDRQTIPDEASVAIALPVSTRPDQKASADGLRPADPARSETYPSMATIRSLGGDYARVDRRGKYRLRVTAPGRYYVLIVSHHARRASDEQPEVNDLAQIGRYIVPATSLLDSQQYTWQEVRVRQDVELNYRF